MYDADAIHLLHNRKHIVETSGRRIPDDYVQTNSIDPANRTAKFA